MKNYNDEALHVACSTDDNYAPLCGVMLCSLLENSTWTHLYVHILIDRLSEDNKQRLRHQVEKYDNADCIFHPVDVNRFEGCKYKTSGHVLSAAAYYRVLLPSILPDVDRVIYIDCDMVITKDISDLNETDLSGYPLAAVEDYGLKHIRHHRELLGLSPDDKYFNSGFLIINLPYWREHGSEEPLLAFSRRERIVLFHDQDALNYVFKGCWLRLPPEWNRFNVCHLRAPHFLNSSEELRRFMLSPAVIHYTDKLFKPWYSLPYIPFRRTWYKYKKMSEWGGIGLSRPNPKPLRAQLLIIIFALHMAFYVVRTSFRMSFCTSCDRR